LHGLFFNPKDGGEIFSETFVESADCTVLFISQKIDQVTHNLIYSIVGISAVSEVRDMHRGKLKELQ
jgi:hypothetical protein